MVAPLSRNMSKVTPMGTQSQKDAVLDSFLGFALQAVVVETAIVATKSVAWLLMMMGTLPNGIDVFIKVPEAYAGFPLAQLLAVRKPGPENKDASDNEDDDEEEEAADDQDEDEGEEEDGTGEDAEDEDPENEPEANGDGGSGEDEDGDDDDDDDDDEEEEEEDEEEDEEEEEEEELQPPAKKRK